MGVHCPICGKKASVGNQVIRRGKAKYLGGVGRKITGTSKRLFKPNLQRIQISLDGVTKRVRVCVQCIRSGRVQRPQKSKPFAMKSV
jgi:large subunit ribosomal protein L28